MKKVILLIVIAALGFTACKKRKVKKLSGEYQTTVADIAFNVYNDSYNSAITLKNDIDAFVANPTAAGLSKAKQSWLNAREYYGQSEVMRFQDGPIDNANGPEGFLNAWPLDEGYIDYTDGNISTGIINNSAITINAATLIAMNEEGGEKNISIGYHAIEFLLWGQDDANTALKTPGNRPYTDYVVGGTAQNPERRGLYLKVCAELLVTHLNLMVDQWKDAGAYRATFLALDEKEALTKVLNGMGILSKSELAGERIFVALDNADQEDEHSCFSDNTHRDIILNAQGIYNLYMGEYTSADGTIISGTSIKDIVKRAEKKKEEDYTKVFETTLATVKAIPSPFDYYLTQETVGGNGPIMAAVKALQNQGNEIGNIASDLELTVTTALPE